jgi:hypothetical protein
VLGKCLAHLHVVEWQKGYAALLNTAHAVMCCHCML